MSAKKKQQVTNHEQRQEITGVPCRENKNSQKSQERVRESVENA